MVTSDGRKPLLHVQEMAKAMASRWGERAEYECVRACKSTRVSVCLHALVIASHLAFCC